MMGNGLPLVTDEGTNARIDHSPPGPIGLDHKGGGAKQSSPNIAEQILAFVRRNRDQRVGNGECFTLADRALRGAGAKSAADYGSVTPDADYVWGLSVALRDLQPGDVIQLRGYRYERTVETEHPDGSESTEEEVQERPHHTAIVESVGANGQVTVLEQNAPEGAAVTRNVLFFSNRQDSAGGQTTTVRVSGTFWFYRAQPR
jgi:hypothetical protein